MKKINDTDPNSERQAEVSNFIGPSVYRDSIYKEN